MSTVCLNCPDRKIIATDDEIYNCHDHCQKYADEVNETRMRKKEYEKGSAAYRAATDYDVNKRYGFKKKYGWNRR